MQKVNDGIISGAVILGAGTFIAKILGALYRAPLTNFIGSYGLGLYQMIFPVYVLLLDLSSAGVPTALAKIISSYKGENKPAYAKICLKKSLLVFGLIGLVGAVVMASLSSVMAMAQGNIDATKGYLFLAPAILPVCLLCCFRGYFQGLMKMFPTAISQITEQVVKLALGLTFAYLFLPNVPNAVAGATLAITISEVVALIQTAFLYKRHSKGLANLPKVKVKQSNIIKNILKTTLPIALTGIILPLSHVADSFIIVNLISKYRSDATALYGLLSGVANTVIGLPVAICYGISTATMPSVSSADISQKFIRTEKALVVTFAVAIIGGITCFLFAPLIVKILFSGLSTFEKQTAVNLIRLTSCAVPLLATLQTENSILIAFGRIKTPPVTLLLGVISKVLINLTLISRPQFNVYGGGFGLIACYFLPCLVNLFIILNIKVKNEGSVFKNRQLSNV